MILNRNPPQISSPSRLHRELKNKAEIKAVKVDTAYNVSDILTKPLAATVRTKLVVTKNNFPTPSSYTWFEITLI